MSEEIILKPSIIKTLYNVERTLKRTGLTEDDILMLIQKRIKGRPSKKSIKAVMDGLKSLEKQLLKTEKLRGE